MGQSRSQTLPLLVLPRGSVLLPGVTLRIPVAGRPDVPALLSSIYSKAKTPRPDASTTFVGCLPLNSPYLSGDGRGLIEDVDGQSQLRQADSETNAAEAAQEDVFGYGTVAKISGVQGRRADDLALVVEGVGRFRVDKVIQERPFLVAEITYCDDESKSILECSASIPVLERLNGALDQNSPFK